MATSENRNDELRLPEVALELFKSRSANMGANPKQLAIGCFRDAKAFLTAAELVMTGEIDVLADDENPLDTAFAPNLKKTHPLNLMSREWGNIKNVEATLAELEANPAADSYELYGWGKPEVNQARALFPAVVDRATQATFAK